MILRSDLPNTGFFNSPKVQTSWPGGIGLEIFKNWCNGIADKTGGELAF